MLDFIHLPCHVIFTNNSENIYKIITGLVDYEMSLKEIEEHVQGYMTRKQQRRDLNPALSEFNAALFPVPG